MLSNKNTDWSKLYNIYETNFREIYKTRAKPQNDSHFTLIKRYYRKGIFNKNYIFGEIGFGAGLTLRMASNLFKEVWGLDVSPQNIEITKNELKVEGYENVKLEVCDILEFNKKFVNRFDVISFVHGLEHFSDDDYQILFGSIKKYLKKNGYFTGALPYNLDFNYRICPNCGEIFEIDGHLSKHDLDSIRNLFLKHGFKIVYLNNFNLEFYLKDEKFFNKLLKLIYYILKKPTSQIEYIVQKV